MSDLMTDDLEEYPSLTQLFAEKGLTAQELDELLTRMERVITYVDAPGIMQEDCASIHGDAVIIFAYLVRDHPNGDCAQCGLWH